MPDQPTCPECGTVLPVDAPAGLCPKCLLKAGIPSETLGQSFALPKPEHLAACFPNLTFLKLLGHGGMGAVYHARQKDLDRDVAVKILPPEVGQDASFAARFAREAKTLAKLNHPNIVQIYDFGRADAYFYFVMEFVDGVNLRQLVQAGEIEPKQTLAIITAICEALQFAHDSGVVHRDIKPENILVDQRGRVKIADFGLAMLLQRAPADLKLTGTHQVMGTPHYMAPEQMRGSRSIDHRVDLYSLGVVFYELLTGELPIGHFEVPSKRMAIDVRLDDVVLRALATEPDRRYQHASDLQQDVEHISATSESHSGPIVPSPAPALHRSESYVADAMRTHEWTAARIVWLVIANLWLLAAIALLLGRKVARTEPLMYSFFDRGAWFYPSTYHTVIGICVGLSVVGFLLALRQRRHAGHRRNVDGVQSAVTTSRGNGVAGADGALSPRYSRQALVGGFWAATFFVNAFLVLFTVTASTVVEAGEVPAPPVPQREWWQWLLMFTILPLGLTAPFGTTILGFAAISSIRHSRGRLIGLPLAVADALFFPLLLLDVVLLVIAVSIVEAMSRPVNMTVVFAVMLIPILGVDYWIARTVWRRAAQVPTVGDQ